MEGKQHEPQRQGQQPAERRPRQPVYQEEHERQYGAAPGQAQPDEQRVSAQVEAFLLVHLVAFEDAQLVFPVVPEHEEENDIH